MKLLHILFLYAFLITYSQIAWSQPPPPSRHGEEGDQPAQQDAPIGGGLAILAGLGMAYGAGKMYVAGKKERRENS